MTQEATPREKRQARAFLQGKGIRSSEIPPGLFATTSKRMKLTFSELLKLIAKMQTGGQGEGQSPQGELFT